MEEDMSEDTFVHLGTFLKRFQDGATIKPPANDFKEPISAEDQALHGANGKFQSVATEGLAPYIGNDEGNLA